MKKMSNSKLTQNGPYIYILALLKLIKFNQVKDLKLTNYNYLKRNLQSYNKP